MRIVNIGLIGLGGMGKIHFHNSMLLKNAKLLAVADISKKSRSLAKAKGVKEVYNDYEKLLENPDIDCVIISLPTFLHAECASRAAEHGKHILIEKPLARNVKEGKQIISKAQENGIKIMVSYPLRFSQFAELKKKIYRGCLGDIVTANATNVGTGPFFHRTVEASIPSPVPSWWFEPKLVGGGALMDLGCHMINLLRWYFEDEISSVKSVLGHRFNMPFEDHALCFIKFKHGPIATVNAGWFSLETNVKVELFGTVKSVSLAYKPEGLCSRILQFLRRKQPTQLSLFHNELNYFIDCIIKNHAPSPSATDGLKDLEIIALAYENIVNHT